MIFVSTLIFCGLVSCGFGIESCSKCTDYNFNKVEQYAKDVDDRLVVLTNYAKDAIQNSCANTTCPYASCPDGWVSYKKTCYLFENRILRNFADSRTYCKSLGADLVHVEDETENNFIAGVLKGYKDVDWWLGVTDAETEGIWKWVDTNTVAEVMLWRAGEPNGATGSNCAFYYKSAMEYDTWIDAPCSWVTGHICEKMPM